MNDNLKKTYWRITVTSNGCPLVVEFPELGNVLWGRREITNGEFSFYALCDEGQDIPKTNEPVGKLKFHTIIDEKTSSELGKVIQFTAKTSTVNCTVKEALKIPLPNVDVPLIRSAFYRLTIALDSWSVDGTDCFLSVNFDDSACRNREVLRCSRTFFVLCDGRCPPPMLHSEFGKDETKFVQIIDPDTLVDMGKTLTCSAVDSSGRECGKIKCVVKKCEEVHPPQWVPVVNDKMLKISTEEEFLIGISDRKLGEISYRTKLLNVRGVDIRIYGNGIKYNGDRISVTPLRYGDEEKYLFSIKGGQLSVDNLRTVDVDEIQISARARIDVELQPKESKEIEQPKKVVCLEYDNRRRAIWGFGCLVALTIVAVLVASVLSAMNATHDVANKPSGNKYYVGTNESHFPCTNTLSVTTCCDIVNTNTVVSSVSSVLSQPHVREEQREALRSGGITLCVILSCLLYVALYGGILWFTVKSWLAYSRQEKLTGDLSGVLNALRAEKDRKKRQEMQKKILDDMIDTYLDRPSSDE